MRRALSVVFILLLALSFAAPARAQTDEGSGNPGSEQSGDNPGTDESSEDTGGTEDEGASDPAAETGGEEEGAAEETGPPWTYQMARMSLVLLLLLGGMLGLMYKKLVADRARRGV